MNVVILCGGRGTRLYPDTEFKPKPMVEIGGKPILWHILKIYERSNYNNFVLALGYRGLDIKKYFLDYNLMSADVNIDLSKGVINQNSGLKENWKINMIDTGVESMTGGRLLRLENTIRKDGTFMLTYGDGLSDINIKELVDFHKSHGKIATVTAVRPRGRFGVINFDGEKVTDFHEKPQVGEGWINGGFFVFEPEIFDYLSNDSTVLEGAPMQKLTKDGQLMAFKYKGAWQCMDTPRDRDELNALCIEGNAFWNKLEI